MYEVVQQYIEHDSCCVVKEHLHCALKQFVAQSMNPSRAGASPNVHDYLLHYLEGVLQLLRIIYVEAVK